MYFLCVHSDLWLNEIVTINRFIHKFIHRFYEGRKHPLFYLDKIMVGDTRRTHGGFVVGDQR